MVKKPSNLEVGEYYVAFFATWCSYHFRCIGSMPDVTLTRFQRAHKKLKPIFVFARIVSMDKEDPYVSESGCMTEVPSWFTYILDKKPEPMVISVLLKEEIKYVIMLGEHGEH